MFCQYRGDYQTEHFGMKLQEGRAGNDHQEISRVVRGSKAFSYNYTHEGYSRGSGKEEKPDQKGKRFFSVLLKVRMMEAIVATTTRRMISSFVLKAGYITIIQ